MENKLTYNSTYNEVGCSLRVTLDEIKKYGETKELKYEMLLKYGSSSTIQKSLCLPAF
jgi:ketopantoate reductase